MEFSKREHNRIAEIATMFTNQLREDESDSLCFEMDRHNIEILRDALIFVLSNDTEEAQ